MKKKTNCTKAMEEDLMKVFREVSMNYDCRCNEEAYKKVVAHPAPRFYVDARFAHVRLSPMLRGDRSKIERLSPLKKEMYEALFDKVMSLWQKPRFCGKKLYYVLQFAVLEPAPRFYISTIRMGQIWRRCAARKNKS